MNYEQYHQKGGTYVIPVEVFDDLLDEKEELEKENQQLKGSIQTYYILLKANVEENQKLKKQLEYIRSGEYYNQLRFERDMLQDIVDNGEVSKEDKEFIDCTHRNTELLEEKQELIDYLKGEINDCPLTGDNDCDMFYIGKMRACQEILSKIEKE